MELLTRYREEQRHGSFLSFRSNSQTRRADIKSLPSIIRSEFEQAGITLHGLYLTLGRHDAMCIFDAPSDDSAVAGLLQVNTLGLGRTETVRAYTFDEFEAAASQIS